MSKLIGLMDCNNFYVACERLFQPKLARTPVVILSHDNGCIVARSNRIKQLQIPIGTPIFQVRSELNKIQAIAITANMRFYREISARVMQTLKILTQKHIVYSIDEAFFEIEDNQNTHKTCQMIASTIEQWTGIPVAIGVSYSKTLAKLACKQAKNRKSPVIAIELKQIQQLLAKTPVADIWGIGRQNSKKLQLCNINYALELIQTPPSFIKKHLGIEVLKTTYELQGINAINIEHALSKQSLSSSKILIPASNEAWRVRQEIARHIGIICAKAFKQSSNITCMVIKLYTQEFTFAAELQHHGTNLAEHWLNLASSLFEQEFGNNYIYRRVKINAILADARQKQLMPDHPNTTDLIQNFQKKFGSHSLYLAAGAYQSRKNAHNQ